MSVTKAIVMALEAALRTYFSSCRQHSRFGGYIQPCCAGGLTIDRQIILMNSVWHTGLLFSSKSQKIILKKSWSCLSLEVIMYRSRELEQAWSLSHLGFKKGGFV